MARVTIEDCLAQVDSRFSLVHLAVRRVLQLRGGAAPTMEVPKNKEVVVALREIAAGTVTPDNVRQLEENRVIPEARVERTDEVMRQEVKEILETETQHNFPVGFDSEGGAEQLLESNPDEPFLEPGEEND
ncbi:MAG: DNA-directed RNA polymerase subunit omega [Acidobacteriota bacterium]